MIPWATPLELILSTIMVVHVISITACIMYTAVDKYGVVHKTTTASSNGRE